MSVYGFRPPRQARRDFCVISVLRHFFLRSPIAALTSSIMHRAITSANIFFICVSSNRPHGAQFAEDIIGVYPLNKRGGQDFTDLSCFCKVSQYARGLTDRPCTSRHFFRTISLCYIKIIRIYIHRIPDFTNQFEIFGQNAHCQWFVICIYLN